MTAASTREQAADVSYRAATHRLIDESEVTRKVVIAAGVLHRDREIRRAVHEQLQSQRNEMTALSSHKVGSAFGPLAMGTRSDVFSSPGALLGRLGGLESNAVSGMVSSLTP